MGHAPGLALQVSGVNEIFWSVLNGVLLLLFCLPGCTVGRVLPRRTVQSLAPPTQRISV